MQLFFLLTSHNRADLTVRCLHRLKEICNAEKLSAYAVLIDAGSTDDTRRRAKGAFDGILVRSVTTNVHWAEGMAQAEKLVLDELDPSDDDLIVWLNDDVLLDRDALRKALLWIKRDPERRNTVFSGSMRSADGSFTYGGLDRSRWSPLRIRLVQPGSYPIPVDTFHGNFLWVPVKLAKKLGGIDGLFGHHMADIDYGVRNVKEGNRNVLLPESYGICENNDADFSSLAEEWSYYRSIKGSGHWATRARFLKKHTRVPRVPALLAMDAVHAIRLLRRIKKNKFHKGEKTRQR